MGGALMVRSSLWTRLYDTAVKNGYPDDFARRFADNTADDPALLAGEEQILTLQAALASLDSQAVRS